MLRRIFTCVLLCVFFVSGCAKQSEQSTMDKIQSRLLNMQSYECTATLKRISNKGENTYETKQAFKSTGEYKIEITAPENVAGNVTVFDGKTVCQYNPRVSGKVIADVGDSQQRNEIFLMQFIKNYMQSEEVSLEVANFDESSCTVLEAVIPGNNKYMSTEKLWVDNETLKPVQFVIYDSDGNERYVITYNEFEYDVEFEDGYFSIPQ